MQDISLANEILRAHPSQPGELARLHGVIRSACEQVPKSDGERRARFEAAEIMTRLFANSGAIVTATDLRVVADLIQSGPNRHDRGEGQAKTPSLPEEPEQATSESSESQGNPPDEARDEDPMLGALQSELRLACDLTLGDVLLKQNVIGIGQLERALQEHFQTGERLGNVLLKRESITKAELEAALHYQARLKLEFPTPRKQTIRDDPSAQASPNSRCQEVLTDCLLGEILLRRDSITREQLNAALLVQRATGMRIGEALVDTGAATWKMIEHALELQALRRDR